MKYFVTSLAFTMSSNTPLNSLSAPTYSASSPATSSSRSGGEGAGPEVALYPPGSKSQADGVFAKNYRLSEPKGTWEIT